MTIVASVQEPMPVSEQVPFWLEVNSNSIRGANEVVASDGWVADVDCAVVRSPPSCAEEMEMSATVSANAMAKAMVSARDAMLEREYIGLLPFFVSFLDYAMLLAEGQEKVLVRNRQTPQKDCLILSPDRIFLLCVRERVGL